MSWKFIHDHRISMVCLHLCCFSTTSEVLKKVCWRWHWCQSQRIISWKQGELKWCGRQEEWILNAASPKHRLLLRFWYTAENTHTHTHAWWSSTSSSLPQSMEDEKPMSAHILILKSTVFWFWVCYSRAWSSLLSASLPAGGECVCVWFWVGVCVYAA